MPPPRRLPRWQHSWDLCSHRGCSRSITTTHSTSPHTLRPRYVTRSVNEPVTNQQRLCLAVRTLSVRSGSGGARHGAAWRPRARDVLCSFRSRAPHQLPHHLCVQRPCQQGDCIVLQPRIRTATCRRTLRCCARVHIQALPPAQVPAPPRTLCGCARPPQWPRASLRARTARTSLENLTPCRCQHLLPPSTPLTSTTPFMPYHLPLPSATQ